MIKKYCLTLITYTGIKQLFCTSFLRIYFYLDHMHLLMINLFIVLWMTGYILDQDR